MSARVALTAAAARAIRRATRAGARVGLPLALLSPSVAATSSPSLPQTLYRGTPRGTATMERGDSSRAQRASKLPAPEHAAVTWRQRLPAGVTCNVLVDAAGRVFVVGLGRVTQLAPDGERLYSQRADFAAAVAAALLLDGARVVLTADAHLLSWSSQGEPGFRVALAAPSRWASASLLSLPDGGVMVTLDAWLFNLDHEGALRGHARLKHAAIETLVANGAITVVDERGDVFEWDGYSEPILRGSFGGRARAPAAKTATVLVAILGERDVVELSLVDGSRQRLASFPSPTVLSLLGVPPTGDVYVMRNDGEPLASSASPPLPSPVGSSRTPSVEGLRMLVDADGTLAWLGNESALRLRATSTEIEVPEARCDQVASLVSAGPERLIVACRSGHLWAVGRPAQSPASPAPPVEGAEEP